MQKEILNVSNSSEAKEEERIAKNTCRITDTLGAIAVLGTVLIFVLVCLKLGDLVFDLYDSIFESTSSTGSFQYSTEDEVTVPKGEQVFKPFTEHVTEPGKNFYLNKGELELYITATTRGNHLYIHGEEFHAGGQLIDATIDEMFSYDLATKTYKNDSGTIIISEYNGQHLTIQDNRNISCLPFNGTLRISYR